MEIPSDIKYIRRASKEIEDLLKSKRVDDSLVFDVRLCVEEAVRNAIVHGNKNNKKLPVFITYSFENGKIAIEVQDSGRGFNPGRVPDPTKKENLLKAGGRGVFLIHKLMDEVKYNNSGNKVFMVKSIKKKGGTDAH